jgi:plastocyanin
MRFPLRTPVALTAAAAGLASLAIAAPALAAPAAVDVGDNFFGTDNVTVSTGEAVTWNWVGGGHNVDFISGPEKITASPTNAKGATFSHTFTKPGTYSYICDYHSKMKATVTVVDAAQPGAPAGAPGSPAGSTPSSTGSASQPVSGPAGQVVAGVAGFDAAAPAVSKPAFRKNALRVRLSEAARLTVRYVKTGAKAHTVASRKLNAKKGLNTFAVRRWMRPGTYRVSIVAMDAAGNASKPVRLKLTVRR